MSHAADQGMYVPPEITMFEELFRKKIADWDLAEQPEILAVGNSFWVGVHLRLVCCSRSAAR